MERLLPEYDPRVFFAAERTVLAWIRTGLALMGLGFVVARFDVLSPDALSRAVGAGLILLSVGFIIAATTAYLSTVRRLSRGEPFEGHLSPIVLALAGLLVLLGIMTVIYVFVSPII